jgi:hypothetical protein
MLIEPLLANWSRRVLFLILLKVILKAKQNCKEIEHKTEVEEAEVKKNGKTMVEVDKEDLLHSVDPVEVVDQ